MSASNVSVIFDTPGPRGRAMGRLIGIVGILLCVVLGIIAVYLLRGQLLRPEYWKLFLEPETWQNYILEGLGNTLKATALSVVFAIIFGLVFGVARLSHSRIINIPASIVVEFFRAVPVLMMMLAAWYALMQYPVAFIPGDQIALAAVVIGLTLYNGSVIAELVRSGVHSLPKGQGEASMALGMTRSQTLREVLLPQAITAMLPSLLAQLVVVLKDTALGYIVTYNELLRAISTLYSSGGILVGLIGAALIFIVLNYALTLFAAFVERRLRTRRAGRSVGAGVVPVPGTANRNIRPDA